VRALRAGTVVGAGCLARADARLAIRLILQQHRALPAELARATPIQVITPYNLPV